MSGFNIPNKWQAGDCYDVGKKWGEEEALAQIEQLVSELEKDDSYLPQRDTTFGDKKDNATKVEIKKIKVTPSQKTVLLKLINSIKDSVIKNHKYNPLDELNFPDYDNMSDEERAYHDYMEDMVLYVYPYEWHQFAFGIKYDDGIVWYILYTNKSSSSYEKVGFDLTLKSVELEKLISQPLNRLGSQIITQDMFFGRGRFSKRLNSKRIALVGLGAIGSMVASSLAHCGVSKIGLWDFDIVEPGNICRSAYTIKNIGQSKVHAIESVIRSINPFIETKNLKTHGYSFYANVNYNSQEDASKELEGYDLVIDCTGSNEMLHFLSYAASNAEIISMCITNHANDLLCISNRDGNPFELRKAYLSRIEQDTKNFYIEGEGCYSPTFLANNCDIASLVNLALRDLNLNMEKGNLMHSTIYSYSERGIVADRISTYMLEGYDITLNVSKETLYDAEEMNDSPDGAIG